MKLKRYFLGLAAILTVVGMSSCKGDYDDWADPQSNAEEDAITIPGFTASSTSTEANPVNLNNAQPTKDSVTLASLQVPADYKYGVTNIRVVLKPTGEGAKSTVSKTFDLSSTCNMDSATIQQYVSDSYGLKPVARQFSATVLASAKTGSDYVYVNAGTFNVYIAPKAPVLSETGYYLVGNVQGWNASDTQYKYEFGGASPYDNPEFTIRVPSASLKGGDLQFKLLDLADQGNWDAKTVLVADGHDHEITTDASKPVKATLYDNNGAGVAGAGNIQFAPTTKQYYIIHVNLLDQTIYATAEDIPELFMTGSGYSWGFENAPAMTMVNGHMNLFWTIKYIEAGEEFKFSPKRAWEGDFSPTCNGGDQASHFSTPNNVKCDKSGWYLLVVDRDAHTFKAYTPVVYLEGETSADGWGSRTDADKFTTPTTKDGEFVSPALLNSKAVRIYVDMTDIVGGDWWRAEFGVAANGTIQYRGNSGDDGSSYTSGAGKKIYLNFTTDKGSIK
jgi:hypothetical protein